MLYFFRAGGKVGVTGSAAANSNVSEGGVAQTSVNIGALPQSARRALKPHLLFLK